ncbi:MAG: hypothetical protein JWP04_2866, partial [Belnapia sp.]|nr:hypothetical protein [Belnapia sp.]
MNRPAWLLGGLVIAGALGAWVWTTQAWTTQGATDRAPPAATVVAAPLGVGALGRVEPATRIRKLNQPGGFSVTRLGRLLVAEGDMVAVGQVIAEFADAGQKDAAILQAEAALVQSRAALARIRAAGRPEEIAAQRARIEALLFAERSLRRD